MTWKGLNATASLTPLAAPEAYAPSALSSLLALAALRCQGRMGSASRMRDGSVSRLPSRDAKPLPQAPEASVAELQSRERRRRAGHDADDFRERAAVKLERPTLAQQLHNGWTDAQRGA